MLALSQLQARYLISRTAVGIAAACASLITAQAALAQPAPGVQQSATQTATITGQVVQNDGTPIAGADVRLVGPGGALAKSDAQGVFHSPASLTARISSPRSPRLSARRSARTSPLRVDTALIVQYPAKAAAGQPKTLASIMVKSSGAHINVNAASISSISPTHTRLRAIPRGATCCKRSQASRWVETCLAAAIQTSSSPTLPSSPSSFRSTGRSVRDVHDV